MPLHQTPPPFRPVGPPANAWGTDRSRDQRFDLNPFRGVLCLWIVGIHLWGPAVRALSRLTGVTDLEKTAEIYRLGVECFFVLTGYLLAHSIRRIPAGSGSVGQLVLRRTLRLLVPYQIALVFAGAVAIATMIVFHRGAFPDTATWLCTMFVVGDLFHVDFPIGQFWTMQPMFQFYLAVAAVLLLVRGTRPPRSDGAESRAADLGIAGVAIVSLAYYGLNFPNDTFIGRTWSLPAVAWLMAVGMLTYRVATRRWGMPLLVGVVLFAVAVNAAMLATGTTVRGHSTWGFKVPFAVAALFVLARGYQVPRYLPVRLAAGVGRYSYSVYLTHMIVGSHLAGVVDYYFAPPDWVQIVVLIPAIAVSVLSGVAFYHLVEIRFIAASRRLRPTPAAAPHSDRTPPLGIKLPSPA